jgi:uncharacterized membrane protein SirB2
METLICIILCFIGIATYFLRRFSTRTNKDKEPSIAFWWKDNWPELTQILLFTTGIMIILLLPSTTIVLDEQLAKLPVILQVASKPVVSFGIGLGLSSLIYGIFLKKVKQQEDQG